MKKILHIGILAAAISQIASVQAATAVDWNATTIYATPGIVVNYQGQQYSNKWWTKGEIPSQTGQWGVWAKVAGSTSAPTTKPTVAPTLIPTPTPTVMPTATPTVKPSATPTSAPMVTPTVKPTASPAPTIKPTLAPTATPSSVPTSSIIPPRAITLEQLGASSHASQSSTQLRSFGNTRFQSTGFWVQPGDSLVVSYYYTGLAPDMAPEIVIHNTDDNTWNYDSDQVLKLNVGSNTLTSTMKGALYFTAQNLPTGGEMKVEIVSGGRIMPRFVQGTHTLADWKAMLAAYSTAPYAEIVGHRMMVTASFTKAQKLVDDPAALMGRWDEVAHLADEQYGIAPSNAAPHTPAKSRYHFVEFAPYTGWMYSWNYRMASASDDRAINCVLNYAALKNDGWGCWHELGHRYQMSAMTWDDQGEVSVNLTSAYVNRALGTAPRFETDGHWTKAVAYLNLATRDYQKQDLFVRATMYWQLDLAFGSDFYAKLGTNYRNMPIAQRPSTSDAKKQLFIVEASRVAGYNLTPFFKAWGIPLDAATQTKLSSMALKTLTDPIWLNRDSNVAYKLY